MKTQNSQEPPPVSAWMEDALAMMELASEVTAALMPSRRIVERHVVIRDECRVREAVFYADDRPCDIRRKIRTLKGVW